MPSACTKPENKVSLETVNHIEKCITIVEKKVRNLEKRKQKLEAYRSKKRSGEELNEDQKDAIGKYDAVMLNLEFARDLQKQFKDVLVEFEKLLKKKSKREKAERQEQEMSRFRELLKLNDLLSQLGSEDVREDFKNGANGAITLTDENLEQFDELYKLITPSREGDESFADQLMRSSEHIVNFLDARDKEVAGTTYKQLKELADLVNECGYFDNIAKRTEEPAVEEKAETVEPEVPPALPQEPEDLPVVEPVIPEPTSQVSMEPITKVVPQEDHPTAPVVGPTGAQPITTNITAGNTPIVSEAAVSFEDEAFFTTTTYDAPRQRGRAFQDIVSSVQGNFNFLQDSEIDLESPHRVDPAVVAAHPMVPGMNRSQDAGLTPSGFQGSSLLGSDDQTASAASTYSQQTVPQTDMVSHHAAAQPVNQSQRVAVDSMDFGAAATPSIAESIQSSTPQLQFGAVDSLVTGHDSQNPQSSQQQQQQPSSLEASYDQSYGQNLMSQSLGGSTSSQHFGEQSASSLMSSHISLGDQEGSASTGPQPIPLPNQTMPGQSLMGSAYSDSDNAASSQEKKAYTMNPNADPFKSATIFNSNLSSSSGSHGGASGVLGNEEPRKSAWNTVPQQTPQQQQQQQQQDQESDYQNAGFGGSSQFVRSSGPPPRGSTRGSGRGGRGASNNGFSRGGSRGGSSYGGSRGGGNYSNGRGGRGGSAWQGYPPRNDYRPEGGYQGYSGSFSNANGMRGGGPPRGSGPRGGRGGFNRPSNSPYSQ